MQENIIPYSDFTKLPDDEKKKLLIEYRNKYKNSDLLTAWGISSNGLYRYIRRLDIPKARRAKTNVTPVVKKAEKTEAPKVKEPVAPVADEEGFELRIHGKYEALDLLNRLEKIALILSDEDSQFDVVLKIKEAK